MNKILKTISIISIMIITISMFSCSSGNADADLGDISSELLEDTDETFKDGTYKEFKRYYGLNANDYDEVILKLPSSNMDVNEILIVKVKEESDIELLEDAIDSRVQNQGDIFKDYAPEQYAIIQDYETYVKGNIIFFVISKDAEKLKKNFKGYL